VFVDEVWQSAPCCYPGLDRRRNIARNRLFLLENLIVEEIKDRATVSDCVAQGDELPNSVFGISL
jgi:hypothetical protein